MKKQPLLNQEIQGHFIYIPKILIFSLILVVTQNIQGQTQLKQFGTKIFDENGQTIKLFNAVKLSKPKSEKAYVAFKLAYELSEGRSNEIVTGFASGLLAVVPLSIDRFGYLQYNWLNAYFAVNSILNFAVITKKKEIEEVLAIGVKAFNESSTSNE